jgi:hypothetical protein
MSLLRAATRPFLLLALALAALAVAAPGALAAKPDCTVSANTITHVSQDVPSQYVSLFCSAATGDQLTYTIASPAAHGTLSAVKAQPTPFGATFYSVDYTPAPGYHGTDSFDFKADNGTDSATGTVHLVVDATGPPACPAPDPIALRPDHAKTYYPGCHAAFTSGPIHYEITSPPSNGTATTQTGGITYTPAKGYTGSDSFAYKAVNDAGASTAQTQAVTVSSTVNTAPTCGGTLPAGKARSGVAKTFTFACYDLDETRSPSPSRPRPRTAASGRSRPARTPAS